MAGLAAPAPHQSSDPQALDDLLVEAVNAATHDLLAADDGAERSRALQRLKIATKRLSDWILHEIPPEE